MRSRSDLLWLATLVVIAAMIGWLRIDRGRVEPPSATAGATSVVSVPASASVADGAIRVILVDSGPGAGDAHALDQDLCLRGPGIAFNGARLDRKAVIRLLHQRFPGVPVTVYGAQPAATRGSPRVSPGEAITVADGGLLVLGKNGLQATDGLLIVVLGPAADTSAIRALLCDNAWR